MKLADEYPEYVFVASQMQQFKWLKQYHPEILSKIHEKFATNQFIPLGGTWVENDTNLPNGESLLRQFVLGQRFLLDEFGFQSDIFGYPIHLVIVHKSLRFVNWLGYIDFNPKIILE